MKKLLLGLLPLVGLVVLLELVLWAGGWGESGVRTSMSRGFDRDAAYIVPDPQVPGGWRTQMFGQAAREVAIAPKGARRRLLLLGGSNTQGFPADVLQRELTEVNPIPGWEVVNLGREGYGSERVRILLGQALDLLEPDAVLLYSGHNEFMERGFAGELASAGALGWMGSLAETLMGLRTMNLAMDALASSGREHDFGTAPEPRVLGRDEAFNQLDYATTLVYYDAFRINIEQMCRDVLRHGVGLVLCTVVGNDFTPPYQVSFGSDVSPGTQTAYLELRDDARRLIPQRFRGGLYPAVRLSQPDWGLTLPDATVAARLAAPPAGDRRVPVLRPLLGPLAEAPATHAHKGDSIAGAHWSDPRLWTPAVYDLLETMQAVHHPALSPDERAGLARARNLLDQALAQVPAHPSALFDRGLINALLGEDAAARADLAAATDHDRAPRRGADLVNASLRSVHAEVGRGELFDADAFFRSHSPGGLLSYEVLTDVCHLQPGVRVALMQQLVPQVLVATASMQGTR